jgi:hypothetical protein
MLMASRAVVLVAEVVDNGAEAVDSSKVAQGAIGIIILPAKQVGQELIGRINPDHRVDPGQALTDRPCVIGIIILPAKQVGQELIGRISPERKADPAQVRIIVLRRQ